MNREQSVFPIMDREILIEIGLTKREYFAGLAMQAQMTNGETNDTTAMGIAKWSVAYADALLAELAKGQE